jgi:hypothetical protein
VPVQNWITVALPNCVYVSNKHASHFIVLYLRGVCGGGGGAEP